MHRPTMLASSLALLLLCGACRGGPDVAVVASIDLGPLETHASIRARDGGYSGLFQGRSVWLYGDSILGLAGEDGSSWRDNSWSWTEDDDASDGITGFSEPLDALDAPHEFFPETNDEHEFNVAHAGEDCEQEPCGARQVLWPGPLVEDAERDRALVFYSKIHGEPGPWNFRSMGCSVAIWEDWDAGPTRPEVFPDGDEATLLWSEDDAFCASAALIEDGWLWAWSCVRNPWKPCHLARVAPADSLDPSAWRYYAGDETWSEQLGDAVALFEAMDMTSIHRNPHLDRLVAIYSDLFDDTVSLRTAERPQGPWSEPVVLFEAEAPAGDGNAYSGLGHGEFMGDDGALEYVSYYRSTGDWDGEIRLVEVELEPR